jgi:hypothetical protein
MLASLENRPEGKFAGIYLSTYQTCMWQRELFFSEGWAWSCTVDIGERLVHLLVFYYNTVNIFYPFSLKLNINIRFFTCLCIRSY